MERQLREQKYVALSGVLFDASIKPGGKTLETYSVLVEKVGAKKVLLKELCVPPRYLSVPRKEFESGKIGIMEFKKVESIEE